MHDPTLLEELEARIAKADADPHPAWRPFLAAGERILWEGRPVPGFKFSRSALMKSGFGLFFLLFSLFWMAMAFGITSVSPEGSDDPIGSIFPLFGLPFVVVGGYLTFGHFLWDKWKRDKTNYALSDRRAFIATDLLGKSLKSYPIEPQTVLTFEPAAPPSVYFAEKTRRTKNGSYTVPIGFERIDEGEDVYRLLLAIQERAS